MVSDSEVARLMREVDSDGSGALDFAEFVAVVKALLAVVRAKEVPRRLAPRPFALVPRPCSPPLFSPLAFAPWPLPLVPAPKYSTRLVYHLLLSTLCQAHRLATNV